MSADVRTQVSFAQNSNPQSSPTAVFVEPLVTPAPPRELSQRDEEYRREATYRGLMYLYGGMSGIKRWLQVPQGILLGIRLGSPFVGLLPRSVKDGMRKAIGTTDLGMMFVGQDFAQARHWLGVGKDLGSAMAAGYLGKMNFFGLGSVPDFLQALKYLKLGMCFYEGEKQRKPSEIDSVMDLDSDFVVIIGYIYQHGLGVDQDIVLAGRWYEKAIENGDKKVIGGFGYHALGDMYRIGLGVSPDYSKANDFYMRAITQYQKAGTEDADGLHLGRLFRYGLGAPADAESAKRWFTAYRATNNPFQYRPPEIPHFDAAQEELADLAQHGVQDAANRLTFLLHPLEKVIVEPIPPSISDESTRDGEPVPSVSPAVVAAVDGQGVAVDRSKLEQSLAKLDGLIGLPEVKGEIRQLVDIALFNQQRMERGLKPLRLAMHLVFTGNPGTGKTTVARLLGDIYASLNLLKSGHLVETDKSGLTGQYLGESTARTKAMIEKALDGVLFIDEAYALTRSGVGNQYGQEAVDILLKEMEDNRDRLVVIAAGYPAEMREFVASNPGLASRFTNVVQFRDYTAEEMVQIFELFAHNNEMRLSPEARKKLEKVCGSLKEAITVDFANGRLVRNLFEQATKNMARRVASGSDDLETMIEQDVPDFSSGLGGNAHGD